MDTLHSIAIHQLLGMPVWVWALVIFIGAVNEAVQRSNWTEAQTLLQIVARGVLKVPAVGAVFARFPLLGDVLRMAARLDKPAASASPPAAPPITTFIAISLMLHLSACAHLKAFAMDFAACGAGKVPGYVQNIMGDVADVLGSESVNWESNMKDLGIKFGLDAVGCATKAIIGQLANTRSSLNDVGRRRLERGQIYVKRLGIE